MRDEKVCPCCGGDLVWKGNVLEGYMHCSLCDNMDMAEQTATPVELSKLQDEEDPDWMERAIKEMEPKMSMSLKQFQQEYLCDYGRQTGRTHAMVLRALDTAAPGELVVILVHHPKMIYYVEDMIKGLGLHKIRPDTFSVGDGTLKVVCPLHRTHSGYGLRCKVFADHACYEAGSSRFWDVFSDWRMHHEILK